MKYILVTGGVISGIGKGVISSSIGTLLKACGLRVTSIKIDPYINIDAGTFSPYEHGEVFVLDDGGEVDLDLGNYERFLDCHLHRDNNITTGKIYQEVIQKERRGDYLGKTVQVVPHICNAIQDNVAQVAAKPVDNSGIEPQVCIIELGGTVGDIESQPFVEAFRQFQFRVGHDNFASVHVSLVPQPSATGEQKTKPTQNSVKELRGEGLAPDVIIARSEKPLAKDVQEKISHFCHVPPNQVICMHDVPSIYRVPIALDEQGLVDFFIDRLKLTALMDPTVPTRHNSLKKWRDLADRYDNVTKEVKIALVGKYTRLEDAYASVVKALKHSSLHLNHRLNLIFIESEDLEAAREKENPAKFHEAKYNLCSADGIIVPGGFGQRGTKGMIAAIQYARENNVPFLGICLGLQVAVIEFAQNVLSWKDANSTEINPKTDKPVVIDMPEHSNGNLGGTMRLGKRRSIFDHRDSIIFKLYNSPKDGYIDERHRHRFEVNPKYVDDLQKSGLRVVARDDTGQRMEIIDIPHHPFFLACQFHPEYLSRPLNPSPPYLGFILAAIDYKNSKAGHSSNELAAYIRRGCRLSPRIGYSDIDSSDEELVSGANSLTVTN